MNLHREADEGLWQDPIVAEARENRKNLEESCGNSFEQIYCKAVEIQQQFGGEIIVAKPGRHFDLPEPDPRLGLPEFV